MAQLRGDNVKASLDRDIIVHLTPHGVTEIGRIPPGVGECERLRRGRPIQFRKPDRLHAWRDGRSGPDTPRYIYQGLRISKASGSGQSGEGRSTLLQAQRPSCSTGQASRRRPEMRPERPIGLNTLSSYLQLSQHRYICQ